MKLDLDTIIIGIFVFFVVIVLVIAIFFSEEKKIICEYQDGAIIESTISISPVHGKYIAINKCKELKEEPKNVYVLEVEK